MLSFLKREKSKKLENQLNTLQKECLMLIIILQF